MFEKLLRTAPAATTSDARNAPCPAQKPGERRHREREAEDRSAEQEHVAPAGLGRGLVEAGIGHLPVQEEQHGHEGEQRRPRHGPSIRRSRVATVETVVRRFGSTRRGRVRPRLSPRPRTARQVTAHSSARATPPGAPARARPYAPAGPTPSVYGSHHSSKVGCRTVTEEPWPRARAARCREELREVALARAGEVRLASTPGSSSCAACQNGLSGPVAPGVIQTQAARTPSRRVTRRISASPPTGSDMKWTTSWASAASNVPVRGATARPGARCTVTPGLRTRAAATKLSDGSTAETASGPEALDQLGGESTGPQPTSSTRWPPDTPARSASFGASRRRVPAHEPVVRIRLDLEAHAGNLRARAGGEVCPRPVGEPPPIGDTLWT